MINVKDTKIIKELVLSALMQAIIETGKYNSIFGKSEISFKKEIKPFVERSFDIVIHELKLDDNQQKFWKIIGTIK